MKTPIKRPCVLIVEDDGSAREMYRMTLELSGFDVVEAADGVEALLRVRDMVPDLIVMDLLMPLMDGWDTTRHLKSDSRTAGIPIVMLTGHTPDGMAQATRKAGCVALVTKPCQPAELVEKVRRCLSV